MKQHKKQIYIRSNSRRNSLEKLIKIFQDSQLYFNGGSMIVWSRDLPCIKDVFLAVVDGKFVGCCIVLKEAIPANGFLVNIGTFVKEEYQRKNVATNLLKAIIKKYPNFGIKPWMGSFCARHFYESLGLTGQYG